MARERLLKRGEVSAVASTSVLARVSRGTEPGSDSRACRAASFGEVFAADTGGEGSLRRVSSERMGCCVPGEGDWMSSDTEDGGVFDSAAVARHRLHNDWESDWTGGLV